MVSEDSLFSPYVTHRSRFNIERYRLLDGMAAWPAPNAACCARFCARLPSSSNLLLDRMVDDTR